MPIEQLVIQTGDDTYVTDLTPNSNFGSNASLFVGYDIDESKDEQDFRALLRYDVSAVSSYTILSATLTLTLTNTPTAQTITLYRSGQPAWTEAGATWNNYDGVSPWSVEAGDPTTPSDTVAYSSGDLVFDATDLVIDAIDNRSSILDCVVDSSSTSDDNVLAFASFENPTAASRPNLTINYLTPETASGGVELSGEHDTLTLSHLFRTGSGGVELSYSPTNPPITKISNFIVDQVSSWNVYSTFTVSLESQWDIGGEVLRYYMIEGDCESPPACETTGFDFNDSNCDGGVRFFQTIAATSLADLCEKMQATYLNYPVKWPVKRIRRFSRPVYLSDIEEQEANGIDHSCNELEDQVFCHVPECFDFCIDERVDVSMGVEVFIQDSFYNYQAAGGLILDGTVLPEYDTVVPVGGITLAGSADAAQATYEVSMDGGVDLAGESLVSSPDWHYVVTSGVVFSGEADINASDFDIIPVGGITLSGAANTNVVLTSALPNIGLVAGGEVDVDTFDLVVILDGDGVSVAGIATVNCSNWTYSAAGSITLSGESLAKSPVWHYTPGGGLSLSNPELMRYLPNGGLTLGGDSIEAISIYAEGGVELGGESSFVSPDWHYTPGDGLTVGGSIETSFLVLGDFYIDMGAETELLLIEPVYPISFDTTALTSEVGLIVTSCLCDPTPNRLKLSHNIGSSAILKNFLLRNGLELPSQLNLIFNDYDDVWRVNKHFKGTGTNLGERWVILFEWACRSDSQTEDDEPIFSGGKYWKFSLLVKREVDNDVRESRIFYTFPEESPCDDDQLRFSFRINTNTKAVSLPVNLSAGNSIIYDDLGLFSDKYWQKNPSLSINVFESDLPDETPTVDISTIFPESSTIFPES
ncbi:MAG: hypothetical protein DWQ19_10515 [Crenarchaeota archaeon]|nr:MAG: hypothetical protein DWQ19_10515 [Thermoproteota archaeon]